MCTTGVLSLVDGSSVLFKNKDFGRSHLDDRVWLDADVFGVCGMTTWAGDDPALDDYSGFSIGANSKGLLCCDSNVVTLDGFVNYDLMTEVALRQGVDVASAAEAIRAACEVSPASWGNIVMIDANGAASVEIRGADVVIVALEGPTARSNHHVVLGQHEMQEDHATTVLRLDAAQRRLEVATTLADVFDLQRSHDDGDSGVCNHVSLTTVYSYVLQRTESSITLHVLQGRPCSGAERVSIEIPFRDLFTPDAVEHFMRSYPTAAKQNTAELTRARGSSTQ